MRKAGFTVMMDDFGSGYSSLNTLKDIPVNVLKIDMKFLSSKSNKGRDECILSYVIRMAGWLGMPVIMEGVETKDQINFLKSTGCGYVQGYYYTAPMPVSDYENLISMTPQRSFKSLNENNNVLLSTVWPDQMINDLLFNSVKIPSAICETDNDEFHLIKVNSAFIDSFLGTTALSEISEKLKASVSESDYRNIIEAFKRVGEDKQEISCNFTFFCDGKKEEASICLQYWGKIERSSVLFVQFYFNKLQ
jgi:hypothetical protein